MTNIEKIQILKDEANKNPATMAALLMFKERERPRSTVTLVGLEHRMWLAGYKYGKKDYEPLLRILELIGVGKLDFNTRGSLVGLKDINVHFNSIAEAVFGTAKEFKSFKPRSRPKPAFHKIKPKAHSQTIIPAGLTVAKPTLLVFQVDLDIIINGKHVRIPVPKDLSSEDLAALIGRFKEA